LRQKTQDEEWSIFADGIPIVVRVIKHKNFKPGPFRLGSWQLPINLAAVFWVITSSVRKQYNTLLYSVE
jgi:hypothetical protein